MFQAINALTQIQQGMAQLRQAAPNLMNTLGMASTPPTTLAGTQSTTSTPTGTTTSTTTAPQATTGGADPFSEVNTEQSPRHL